MIKDVTSGPEALQKLKAGVDKLANVVKSTLGPGGNNVILQRGDTQAITKDGVSVAREIWLEDPIENSGAQFVKEAAERTVAGAGDGTTTATVLAQAIFTQGLDQITAGAKLIDVKRGIDKTVARVVQEIKSRAKQIEKGDVRRIAMISSNGDETIGGLVAEAIEAVGLDGIVTVEESKSLDTYVKRVEGMQWDRGFLSHLFITNNEKMECYLEDPVVLVYDGTISALRELMGNNPNDTANIIHRYRQGPNNPELHGLPLFIVCNDAGAEFVSTLAYNHNKGAIKACVVQAPEFQSTRKAILHDIAAMTGATVISKDAGFQWKDVKPEHLGRCEAVRVTQWTTTIIGGRGGLKATNRANGIREQIKEDANEAAVATLRRRLARLVDGLMVIYVGGSSVVEVSEKKDRIDDSLNATRAAIEEGVLPGGGVAYMRIARALDMASIDLDNDAQVIGASIVLSALDVPFKTIMDNIGADDLKFTEVLDNSAFDYGYNAQTMQYENFLETGVIDPAKVVRLALENAASVAGMLLTTKAIVSYKKPTQ